MKPYIVHRQPPTRTPDDLAPPESLGGPADWYWGIPGTFQALASPQSNAPVPAVPTAGDPDAAALGYWTALHNLLLYRLGWARPDLGLIWWFEQGKPTDDPTLALIAQIWDSDDRLDGYLSWLLHSDWRFLNPGEEPYALGTRTDTLSPEWLRWLEKTDGDYSDGKYPWFHYPDGGDSLHLSRSGGQRHIPNQHAVMKIVDRIERRAIILTDRADSWYFTLKHFGDALPGVQSRSWHVDVIVRSIGILGTFRPSRDTGFWFTGRHSVHVAGSDPR